MTINREAITEWIKALRDPDLKQGIYQLGYPDGRRCCLGVACDLAVAHGLTVRTVHDDFVWYDTSQTIVLPKSVSCWLGIRETNPSLGMNIRMDYKLSDLNDEGFTFPQIADLIEYFILNQDVTEWD